MLSKFLHILCTCLLCCGVATAQVPADSIDRAAQDEDFVRASLLVIGPGDNVVTCFGHAAIRMQCPTHQLDYCFTFEMKLAEGEHTKFLTGQAKAGFMAAPTGVFMQQYKRQGRSIDEYDLNLTPKQEQTLWRNLDREIAQEARWSYDFITVNCGSMCVWIIQQSLLDEHIEYQQLPTVLQGTYSDVMDYVGEDAPWLNLYFHVRYFSRRNDTGALADKMPSRHHCLAAVGSPDAENGSRLAHSHQSTGNCNHYHYSIHFNQHKVYEKIIYFKQAPRAHRSPDAVNRLHGYGRRRRLVRFQRTD